MSSESEIIPESELLKTEITVLKKQLTEKDLRLQEAFELIEDKEQEIERQRLAIGDMELCIVDLKKKPSEQLAKLQADYDIKCEEVKELRAIEGQRTKEHDFIVASKVSSPPPQQHIWVAAINAFNLYKGLKDGSMHATSKNDPWHRVVFDVAADGQLKNARLEEDVKSG